MYYRKVIRIKAEDSPNVRLAKAQLQVGVTPTGEQLIPGVLSWREYQKRRATWDESRQCIGLEATFWEGSTVMLTPPQWLDRAERIADQLRERKAKRLAKGIGIDPAEGGDSTTMSAVDEYGLIELVSKKTPDTSVITEEALAFMLRHNVPPERVCFDRGGGGKQHADRLRRDGYAVRTVGFGEAVVPNPRWGAYLPEERMEQKEQKWGYINCRAMMYGWIRTVLDPASVDVNDFWSTLSGEPGYPSSEFIGFGLPREYEELRRQLGMMPLLYDREGRMRMLPKNKTNSTTAEKSLTQLLGCSPDEADSLALAIYAMVYIESVAKIGVLG